MLRQIFISLVSIALVADSLMGCVSSRPEETTVRTEIQSRTGVQVGNAQTEEFVNPPGVELNDGLSRNEAVAIALMNNPEFKAQLALLGVSTAELVRARTLPNPSLSAVLGSNWEATLLFPFDALWKARGRVEVAQKDLQSKSEETVQSGLNLALAVQVAHIDAMLAQGRATLFGDSLARNRRAAEMANSRLRAGDASQLEAASAAAEEAAVAEEYRRAQLERDAAVLSLRRLCQLDLATWNGTLTPTPAAAAASLDLEALIGTARENRPDLRAAVRSLEAAREHAQAVRSEVVNFAAGAKVSESDGERQSRPAVDLSIPIFDRRQADALAAAAKVDEAAQRYRARIQQADVEVREAVARLQQAHVSLDAWRNATLPTMTATLASAERSYAAGDVSYTVVLDSTRRLIDARLAETVALADAQRAAAVLAHHIGAVPPQ